MKPCFNLTQTKKLKHRQLNLQSKISSCWYIDDYTYLKNKVIKELA